MITFQSFHSKTQSKAVKVFHYSVYKNVALFHFLMCLSIKILRVNFSTAELVCSFLFVNSFI